MKRWALLVAILYALILALLALPTILIGLAPGVDLKSAAAMYIQWQWWLILALMGLAQASLLAVPVRVASRRPIARIPLAKTVLVAALMMAGLVVGAFLCIFEIAFYNSGGSWTPWAVLIIGIASWCGWAIVFFRLSQRVDAVDLTSRLCRYLLKGSILELLIAVPTHIVARCRDYCCAGFMTFIGLTLGMAVMLFSFGPGVFFLFVARWRRLHPERSRVDSNRFTKNI
jgi:hypothetical protein